MYIYIYENVVLLVKDVSIEQGLSKLYVFFFYTSTATETAKVTKIV